MIKSFKPFVASPTPFFTCTQAATRNNFTPSAFVTIFIPVGSSTRPHIIKGITWSSKLPKIIAVVPKAGIAALSNIPEVISLKFNRSVPPSGERPLVTRWMTRRFEVASKRMEKEISVPLGVNSPPSTFTRSMNLPSSSNTSTSTFLISLSV